MFKFLITGAAGFIGSNLSISLLQKGYQVTGIDNMSSYYTLSLKNLNKSDIITLGCDFNEMDLCKDKFDELDNDFDFIIHLAAQPGISADIEFKDYADNNINATANILDFARKNKNLKLFIYGSTSSVYGKFASSDEKSIPFPASDYGLTKLAAEQMVMMYGREYLLPVSSLRLFSVFGERERPDKLFPRLFASYFNDEPISIYKSSFEHKRSFTYVGDIINAINLVVGECDVCKNEIFNIGSTSSVKVKDALEVFERVTGKKIKYNIQSDRPGDQLNTKANIEKAKSVFGFKHKFSLEEGLRKTFVWHKNMRGG